jgi:flavin-dependent dehydrogenase
MRDACDVLIVGGGPAGSSCAWGLRASGLDVLVLDRRPFPRDKVCAGWITPQVAHALQLDLHDYARHNVCQPITGFRTGLIGGPEVQNHFGHPVSYGIRRREFDAYLLDRAAPRRAAPEAVERLERCPDGWLVNGQIRARLLVGAGGHFCPVARMLGARQVVGPSVIAAQEIEFAPSPHDLSRGTVEPQIPELFFCSDLEGYGWCFRKGDYLNIGLGRARGEGLSGHVQAFVDFLRARGKLRANLPARFQGHAYQLYERCAPKLVDEQVLLVGDAAGLAYPQSGEGIRPAVEAGLLAAQTIVEAQGRYALDRLEPYRQRLLARLGPPRSSGAAGWLPARWLHTVAARLITSKRFARHVVLKRWFLHMHQPALEAVPSGHAARKNTGPALPADSR